MRRQLFTLTAAASLALFLATAVLLVRSWFVEEHLAQATNSGPAWVVRSFHGRITLDHRSYWTAQGGFTWGRRRISFHENPANALYQRPERKYGFSDIGFYSGTAYMWPGHLYPNVSKTPDFSDPRYWRDDYSALLIPDFLLICIFAIPPLLYLRSRLRQRLPRPPMNLPDSPGGFSTTLAAASFLLLLFLSDLWLHTYTSGRMWMRSAGNRAAFVTVCRNQVHITTCTYRPPTTPYDTAGTWQSTDFMLSNNPGPYPPANLIEQIGFTYETCRPQFNTFRHIALPFWPLWLLSGLLPARFLLTHHRLRRRHLRLLHHQCQSCGYDLTGTPTNICPECGNGNHSPEPAPVL